MVQSRVILGIDPGLAHTGWGIIQQRGPRMVCLAYGCIETEAKTPLHERLGLINAQMNAVVGRYNPSCVAIETVWFGSNTTSAFATGQARGAALVACAQGKRELAEFTPRQIKLAVVGTGTAAKEQVQYMVQHLLNLENPPTPDHAADALAAALCFATHDYIQIERRCLS